MLNFIYLILLPHVFTLQLYYVFCIPIDYLLPCRLHLHGSKYTHHTRELTRTVHIYGFQGRQRSGPFIIVDPRKECANST